jgi:hypothetical protein
LRDPLLLADPLLLGRFAVAPPFTEARPLAPAFALAEGGRLLASSRWREEAAPLFTSFAGRLFADGVREPKPPLFAPLPLFAPRLNPPLDVPLLTRPSVSPRVSIVRTGVCEAAAPGAVRATTERFATEAGGVATRPRAFAAPVKLVRVGVKPARLVTCAPRSDASVTRIDPRLTACPFTKALREAAVTARVSCAYA